jgi:hypothetical protein
MKKIYISMLILATTATSVLAQSPMQRTQYIQENGPKLKTELPIQKVLPIWENDFSVDTDWTISNNTSDFQDWEITSVVNPSQGFNTGSWEDPTNVVSNENGYALFDSDAVGSAGGVQEAFITNTTPIDLSTYPNVIISFNQRFRVWQTSEFIVQISNNGGGLWTSYPVNAGKPLSVRFEEKISVNISSAAGNQANVLVRFTYKGEFDYMWAVDDVQIFEQPANDVKMLSGYIAGVNNEGSEYGRTPLDQVDASYLVGASVNNFGFSAQTGVAVDADFGTFNSSFTIGAMNPEDTLDVENTETPTLAIGQYDGLFTISSNEETSPDYLDNNEFPRSFAITQDVYSLDGIGIHPAGVQALSAISTNSFTDNTDGVFLFTMYHFHTARQVKDVQVMLASNTVAGGSINAYIFDTTSILNNDISQPIASTTDLYDVTAADVTNGFATISLPPTNLAPGAYYIGVELFSNGSNNTISVLDDQTVPQPAAASVVFLPGGTTPNTTYTNGEAFGIRIKESNVGLNEANALQGVMVYPNPSIGVINVSNELNTENNIFVRDIAGKVIVSRVVSNATVLDLTNLSKGTYFVEVSNATGKKIEKVVLR